MNLLLLNYSYLQRELQELGHEVVSAGLKLDCDIVCSIHDYDIQWILSQLDFEPEWIIFMDSIQRVLPTGLETVDVPIAACFIDSTLNRFWQYPFAEICSLVLPDQKPDADYLKSKGVDAHWFPLAADSLIYQPGDGSKTYDLSFIGHRHPENRIKRENILKGLSNHFNVSEFSGDPHLSAEACAMVYQQSKLVLNENLFPSVNLRLFEAMACGTVVLTEDNAPGLTDLFTHKREMLAYNPDNLIELVTRYLDSDKELEQISMRAAVSVGREHSFLRRAEQLPKLLQGCQPEHHSRTVKSILLAESFMNYGLKWSQKDLGRAHSIARQMLDDIGVSEELDDTISIRRQGLEGLLCILSSDLNSALAHFQAVAESLPESGSASDLLSVTKLALLDQTDDARRLTDIGFHMQRGELLLKSGHAFQPGLMAQNLPVHFWSALEHFMFAAQADDQVWELVGDLLMKLGAADQAASAYRAAEAVNEEKLKEADRLSYSLL